MNPQYIHEFGNEEWFKDLFDSAHDLIHIARPDGTLLYANPSWFEALEYSLDEIRHKSVYDLVEDSERDAYIKYREDILRGKNMPHEIAVTFSSKTGKKIILEGFLSARFNEGEPLYTRGIFRDVTLREQSEQNLKDLIYHAPDAIIVINASGRITLWNPKAELIFGWKAEEVLGKPLTQTIIPPIYHEAHDRGMQRYLQTGQPHILNKTIEVTALGKNQKEFPISLTISKSKNGDSLAFIAFIRDITEQKKNEKELERKRVELEASNKEIEQYAWLTSHDLREPLRKILTFSDILLSHNGEVLTPNSLKYITKINDAAGRMNNFIDALLHYSSVRGDEMLFEKTNLNHIVNSVLVDLELMISESGASVQTDDLPVIEAIPFQMKQLFQNLISNAIKYRRHDIHPIIQISSEFLNEDEVQIWVKDNGTGIEQKDLSKIFKLFQRLNAAQQGSGVGLAICKKIVEHHDGAITVESLPLVGTTFYINLPVQNKKGK
ncbi:MAG TPA: PAS domain S-box protein [Flavisolibacter sp.]|nr:PAS domain S-box protein [Flavisolibacter sp.]